MDDDSLIIRCQCAQDCRLWIRLENRDRELLGDRQVAFAHPGHVCPTGLLWDVRTGYLIVQRSEKPAPAMAG
ncbi:MAG TPA: hypothetical protein VFQ71_00475 [Gaiellales bacterium]|jgi:hypothetical protein|nr:hypothetical protein [Gaiellales bacterium]